MAMYSVPLSQWEFHSPERFRFSIPSDDDNYVDDYICNRTKPDSAGKWRSRTQGSSWLHACKSTVMHREQRKSFTMHIRTSWVHRTRLLGVRPSEGVWAICLEAARGERWDWMLMTIIIKTTMTTATTTDVSSRGTSSEFGSPERTAANPRKKA